MAEKLFLKPIVGLAVYLPSRGRNVLPEGENIVVDAYVARRIADGELVAVKASVKPEAKIVNKKPEDADVDSV